jgi:hypothetical protein
VPEQPIDLISCGQFEHHPHVDTARPDESLVQLLHVVGSHEKQPPLRRSHAVQSVQQATERQLIVFGLRVAAIPLLEGGVHVLEQQDAARGRLRHELYHRLVAHLLLEERFVP